MILTLSAFGALSAVQTNTFFAPRLDAEWFVDFDLFGDVITVDMSALYQIGANAGGGGLTLRTSLVEGDLAGAVILPLAAPTANTPAMAGSSGLVMLTNPGGQRYVSVTSTAAAGPVTLSYRGVLISLIGPDGDNCNVATTPLIRLRNGAKVLADKVSDASITDDSWDGFVNDGIEDLWKRVAKATGDAFLSTYDFTLAGGAAENFLDLTTIPARDFRRVRFLELNPDTNLRRRIRPFNFTEKDDGVAGAFYRTAWDDARRYRHMGNKLLVERFENAAGAYRLYYMPKTPKLVGLCDALPDVLDEYAEYPQVFAAMKALGIEESDPGLLPMRLQELRQDVADLKAEPDNDPGGSTIADVENFGSDRWR